MSTIDATWYRRSAGLRERRSAGGVVVRDRGGRVEIALAREGDHPQYVLPKGGIEPGETAEAAARREIAEEAGLRDLVLLADLGTRGRLTFNKRAWVEVHYFLYLAEGEAGTPTDAKHFHPAAWFPLDALPTMFWPEQRELVESSRTRIGELVRTRG